MKKYALEVTLFVCGGVLMVLELIGSRVLAPYLGTSIIVWTSLIGVVLGSLSLGYYVGGRVADKRPTYKVLCFIHILSATFILSISLFDKFIIPMILSLIKNIYLDSLIVTLLLFAPPSVFLGAVSPYCVKLKLKNLASSGSQVGSLYAISTIGSIVGTFLGGFILISFLGTTLILYLLVIILLFLSFWLSLLFNKDKKLQIIILFYSLVVIGFFVFNNKPYGIADIDTLYNRIWIFDITWSDNQKVRMMKINNELSSAKFLNSKELVFDYTKFYRLAEYFHPQAKKTLMIGGAGYSYPQYFLQTDPSGRLDVVEIDPETTALAKKYFGLTNNPRLTIYHQDGRTYLNTTTEKYDVILGDAFKAQTPPYNLTTKEAISKMYNSLSPGGVVLVNIIGSVEGETGKFVKSEFKTFQSVFPRVLLFPVTDPKNGQLVQNVILVALKSPKDLDFYTADKELAIYLKNRWTKTIEQDGLILTDDFSPIERLTVGLLAS